MAEVAPTVDELFARANQVSTGRKYVLLVLFCMSQYLDAFNVSSLFSAIPDMTSELNLSQSESVWIVSAYQLTFAAFLLCSGRVADIYNAKYVFVLGVGTLGVFSLVTGFVKNKIGVFVLRAVMGVSAATSIPASLALIVRLFPGHREKALALSVFSSFIPIGSVTGQLIGAVITQLASWEWVFWLVAIVAIPISIVCAFLVPRQPVRERSGGKLSYLDVPGVSILTISVILLIFAFTSAGAAGWKSAEVLAPLVISVFGMAAFFVYEARIDKDKAAFPPHIWWYTNFAIILALSLSILLWWTTVFFLKVQLWQTVYGWSPISCAARFVPVGGLCLIITLFSRPWTERFETKWVLIASEVLMITGSVILPFADSPHKYWSRDFPAFVIGTSGASFLFVNANVAIFHNTPPEIAGVVGAVLNCSLQLGSAVGAALISSIQSTIDDSSQTDNEYRGRAVGFWMLLAFVVADTIAVVLLYKPDSKIAGTRPWEKRDDPEQASIEVVEHSADKDALGAGEKKQKGETSSIQADHTVEPVPTESRELNGEQSASNRDEDNATEGRS